MKTKTERLTLNLVREVHGTGNSRRVFCSPNCVMLKRHEADVPWYTCRAHNWTLSCGSDRRPIPHHVCGMLFASIKLRKEHVMKPKKKKQHKGAWKECCPCSSCGVSVVQCPITKEDFNIGHCANWTRKEKP